MIVIRRPVPHIAAAARARAATLLSRERDAQDHLALSEAEGEVIEDQRAVVGGDIGLLDYAAPCDVAGVTRLGGRRELRPYRRVNAIRSNQQIAPRLGAICENRRDRVAVLDNALERRAGMKVRGRER